MKNWIKPAGLYALVCAAALLSAMALSRVGSAVAVFSRETGTTVVVDAGHGGEDGGTLSCTGVRESGLNLEIALRVNDLFALLGQRTRMLRTQDVSLHDTDAATIAARKASDIRARVRLTEETPKETTSMPRRSRHLALSASLSASASSTVWPGSAE